MRHRSPVKLVLYAPTSDQTKFWYLYQSGTRRRIATGIPESEPEQAEIALRKWLAEQGGVPEQSARDPAKRKIAESLLDYIQSREDEVAAPERIEYCIKPLAKYFRDRAIDDITKAIQIEPSGQLYYSRAESYDNLLPGGFGCRPLARDCGAGRGVTVMDLPLYAKV